MPQISQGQNLGFWAPGAENILPFGGATGGTQQITDNDNGSPGGSSVMVSNDPAQNQSYTVIQTASDQQTINFTDPKGNVPTRDTLTENADGSVESDITGFNPDGSTKYTQTLAIQPSGSTVASVSGIGSTLNLDNSTIVIFSISQIEISGNGDTITENNADALTVDGGGNSVYAGPDEYLEIAGTGGNYDNVHGGDDVSGDKTANGLNTGIVFDSNVEANMYGSGNTITENNADALTVDGGGNSVYAGPDEYLEIAGTGGNYDNVHGGDDVSGDKTANGLNTGIVFDSNVEANMYGSGNTITENNADALTVDGGGNSVYAGPDEYLEIAGTGGNYDNVHGGDDVSGDKTANGLNTGIVFDSNVEANMYGSGNTITENNADALTVDGGGNSVYAGPDEYLEIAGTGGNYDNVHGGDDVSGDKTANGLNTGIVFDSNVEANMYGSGNTITENNADALTVDGGGNSVYAGPDEYLEIAGTGGNYDNVHGGDDVSGDKTANGLNTGIVFDSNVEANMYGSGNTITENNADALTVDGGGNSVYAGPDEYLEIAGTGGNYDNVHGGDDVSGDKTANGLNTGIVFDSNVEANMYGSGNTITENNADALTVDGGGNSIYAGPDEYLEIAGTGGNYDNVHGGDDVSGDKTANGLNTGIVFDSNVEANMYGSGNTITENNADALTVDGGGNSVYAGPDEYLEIAETNGSYDNVHGGDDVSGDKTANGLNTGIVFDSNVEANMYGSGNTITENNADALTVDGGGNSVYAGPDEYLEIAGTGGNYDNVHGSGDAAGATTANGQGAGIILDTNTQATVYGNGDTITENAGDALGVGGNGNTIYAGADEYLFVSGTNGDYDTIYAGSDAAGATTANGQGAGITLDTNTQATVYGNGDTITENAGDALGVGGNGNTIYAGADEYLFVSGTNGDYDTIYAGSDAAGATTANGQGAGITLDTNTQATVYGNGDTITENGGDALGVGGNGNTIYAGADEYLFVSGTNGDYDTIYAGSDAAGATTANGQSAGITLDANTQATVYGNNDTITGNTDAALTIDGTGDTVSNGNGSTLTLSNASNNSFTPGSNATINIGGGSNNNKFNMAGTGDTVVDDGSNNTFNGAIAGANDETFAFGDNSSGNVVTGSNLTVHLGNDLSLTVTGSNDTFTGGDGDTLDITGSDDTVDTDHALVTFSGSHDKVIGTGDEQSGGVYTYTTTYVTTYTYTVFYGLDADVTKPVNAIGQYDLSHGLSADTADTAWSLDEQAIRAGTNVPGAVAPSLLVGGLVDSRHPVTWSFTETAPRGVPLYGGTIQGTYQAAVEQAIDTWSKASGIDFEQVADSASSDIRIGWGNLDTADSGVAGVTLLRASEGSLRPGTMIELENPLQDPLTQTRAGAFTYAGSSVGLEQLALHEIGHALGLAESANPTSIMYPELSARNVTLSASDRSEIAALYPTARDAAATSSMIQAIASFTGTAAPAHTSVLCPPSSAEPLLSVPAHTS
ncbi:matrixin family metalloprotease [Nguyenibacter sp. L1]|uniref:matrixin family metalloprotease n=1 Tax=Nguyenibacter sp. L1 TaxID=3049350 RepID=UPI002B471C95|nr:matrixin family metalloprotease [Nguyenibacter sp. L1]WRH89630.1 matrixin family metalloprotease [Nguyenibacter sp. L1]